MPSGSRSSLAVILAAHGSRRDPEATVMVQRQVAALAAGGIGGEVVAAYHHGEPSFESILDRLSCDRAIVVPFMTSRGHFADVVLPTALRRNRRHGEVRLRFTRPIGTHPALGSLVARRITELSEMVDQTMAETSVLLVGHGTARHPFSRQATIDLVADIERRRVAAEVLPAFLDDEPRLEGALTRLHHRQVVVVPFLIGGGGHATQDLPNRLGLDATAAGAPAVQRLGEMRVILDHPIGHYPELTALVVDLVERCRARGTNRRRLPTGQAPSRGTVYLVGAGPGDPGLITARGLALLRAADVVLHDRLVSPELLAQARARTRIIDVGKLPTEGGASQKRINTLLIGMARQGHVVVRLKGGDPYVFGRGSEEKEACRRSGVPCEVVPGVTSAVAVPAAAGIPVTARGVARSFTVVTGQTEGGGSLEPAEAAALAALDTVVVLMGRSALRELARSLLDAGRDPKTPVACIEAGTTPQQRVARGALRDIAQVVEQEGLSAPVVTVIGNVAAWGATTC